MTSSSDITEIKGLSLNSLIVNAMIASVEDCLQMCEMKVRVVGITKIPIQMPKSIISGLIGLSGNCTGFISISMSERTATLAVSRLSMEEYKTINAQVVDGIGEITNIVAGGLKTKLFNTPWTVNHITIPSVILGDNYNISYSKGIEYCGVTFEVDDPDTITIHDRVFMVSTSLMKTMS